MKIFATLLALLTAAAMAGAYAGIVWCEKHRPPTITIQRTTPAPAEAVMLIRCPVTLREIEEWRRTCRGRTRSDSIKPTERTP